MPSLENDPKPTLKDPSARELQLAENRMITVKLHLRTIELHAPHPREGTWRVLLLDEKVCEVVRSSAPC